MYLTECVSSLQGLEKQAYIYPIYLSETSENSSASSPSSQTQASCGLEAIDPF